MASKQPFKFINLAQKLTTWSIRINKFFKHRLLSKRKNVLIIGEVQKGSTSINQQLYFIDNNTKALQKFMTNSVGGSNLVQENVFQRELIKNLLKTWQITKLQSINIINKQNLSIKAQQKSQVTESQALPTLSILSFNNQQQVKRLQKYLIEKKQLFDSIIILPQTKQVSSYPQIQDEQFATDFLQVYQEKIMKNIVGYRLAHKFLNTSGSLILSTSQYDFNKKDSKDIKDNETKLKQKTQAHQQQNHTINSYAEHRPPAAKQIIDHTLCYLGVVVGDRDYTDLNSWTLVSLSEEAAKENPQFVAKMYYDWADGQQLPMPGSFTLFKKKVFKNNQKTLNFVQYL